jgi:hypothetical protein
MADNERDPRHSDSQRLIGDLIAQPPDPRERIWRWSNLAEAILDEANWIPKPPDPTGNDLHLRHRHAGIGEYQEIVEAELDRLGLADQQPMFQTLVRRYRRSVRRVVREWRRAGLL